MGVEHSFEHSLRAVIIVQERSICYETLPIDSCDIIWFYVRNMALCVKKGHRNKSQGKPCALLCYKN